MHNWITLLHTQHYHFVLECMYSNIKQKFKKKKNTTILLSRVSQLFYNYKRKHLLCQC